MTEPSYESGYGPPAAPTVDPVVIAELRDRLSRIASIGGGLLSLASLARKDLDKL